MKSAVPTKRQLEYQDWEFGLFLHFGIRTFYEGHRDWDERPMHPGEFNPTRLDCNQWVAVAREAGVNYMVLTAKHHDGFANWPSRYTDFSVASSPWKEGTGDVVAEFLDACRRRDMKCGLYYSPAEWGNKTYDNAKAYDDYFINQIGELLTGRGPIDIIWFDGCGSEGHEYDWRRITAEIRRMQPDILIFNMGDPDFRWVGNESGLAPRPVWNTVDAVDFSVKTDEKQKVGAAKWLPAECDCMMRFSNWFYSDSDEHTVKGLDELMGMYYYSVGRGCNLLLNIGPDRRGLLPEADAARLVEFGREIRRRFGSPFATLENCRREGDAWIYSAPEPFFVDHVVAGEELTTGERIRSFEIAVQPTHGGQSIKVYEGENLGHKAICPFPLVRAREIRLAVTAADGEPALRSLELHNVSQIKPS